MKECACRQAAPAHASVHSPPHPAPRTPTQVRDGLVSVVLPLLLARRGVLLQVLTRERVELVHDIQVTAAGGTLVMLTDAAK